METFRWISVVISMILGLGITRILIGAVAVFRMRRQVKLDWLPLTWAAMIFAQQIVFWWSLEELSTLVQSWSFGAFLQLVSLVLSLFLAAALILPQSETATHENLRTFFGDDGCWALPALAGFNAIALVANLVFWNESVLSAASAFNLIAIALPLMAFFGSRQVQAIATAAYVPILMLAIIRLSPSAY